MTKSKKIGQVAILVPALFFACAAEDGQGDTSGGATDQERANSGISLGGEPTPSASMAGADANGLAAAGNTTTGLGALPAEVDSCSILPVIYRDFRGNGEFDAAGLPLGHPDFELSMLYPAGAANWPSDKYGEPVGSSGYKGLNEAGEGLVASLIGTDGKPVFSSGLGKLRLLEPPRNPNNTPQVFQSVVGAQDWNWNWTPPNVIQSASSFSDWYTSDPGGLINQELSGWVKLENGVFESSEFFPLDDAGFGNTPGQVHNYHFTTEAHVKFTYAPGTAQSFEFQGDDDLWIFINGRLAMDLGGVHEPMLGVIDFDAQAESLGLDETVSADYTMDIFHAERQTTQSNFKVTTNIACFVPIIR